MAEHTPGPWMFLKGGEGGDSSVGRDPDPDAIGHCYDKKTKSMVQIATLSSPYFWDSKTGYHTIGSVEGNAALVAAAPDLLDELRMLCERAERCRALLREKPPHGHWGMLCTESARLAIAKAMGDPY